MGNHDANSGFPERNRLDVAVVLLGTGPEGGLSTTAIDSVHPVEVHAGRQVFEAWPALAIRSIARRRLWSISLRCGASRHQSSEPRTPRSAAIRVSHCPKTASTSHFQSPDHAR